MDMLDIITIQSYCIGLMNLNENLTQGDKQEIMEEQQRASERLDRKSDEMLNEIHNHLEGQDAKLLVIESKVNALIKLMEDSYDNR